MATKKPSSASTGKDGNKKSDDLSPREILVQWKTDLHIAWTFLTRLPPFRQTPESQGEIANAMRAFPLTGAAIGAGGGIIYWLFYILGLPPVVCAFVAITFLICITGGLHEDGLSDVADGFFGAEDAKKRLAIMGDSQIGTYGVLALILVVGLKVAIIATIAAPGQVAAVLIAASSASRTVIPALAYHLPPAKKSGLAVHAGQPGEAALYAALGLGAAFTLLFLGPITGIFAILAAGGMTLAVSSLSMNKVEGVTGDVMGSAQQLAEVAVLLVALALW